MADRPIIKAYFKVEVDGVDYGQFVSVGGHGSGSEEDVEDIGKIDKNLLKVDKGKYDTAKLVHKRIMENGGARKYKKRRYHRNLP
jgi:hypothetical protein